MAPWRCPLCGGPTRADGSLVEDPAYRGPAGHWEAPDGADGQEPYEGSEVCWACWCCMSRARWADSHRLAEPTVLPVVVRGVR